MTPPIRDGEKWKKDVESVFNKAFDRAVSQMPEHIYCTSVRPLVRAHQMRTYSNPLSAEDKQAVFAHEMVLDGRALTVQQIEDLYRLSSISNVIL
ncbi:MAG: hypothetical protein ACYC1Z_05430 [Georgenia sp.]